MEAVIVQGMPDSVRRYIVETCSIPASSFHLLPGEKLPLPARGLLFHNHDMTSTLTKFHGSELYVDRKQRLEKDEVYFREVFLRSRKTDKIVEYGVIAIVLTGFTEEVQKAIRADRELFGGLLHKYQIDFKSSPICFFSISGEYLANTPFKDLTGHTHYGRFNRLTKTNGQTIAWIMEILPDDTLDGMQEPLETPD